MLSRAEVFLSCPPLDSSMMILLKTRGLLPIVIIPCSFIGSERLSETLLVVFLKCLRGGVGGGSNTSHLDFWGGEETGRVPLFIVPAGGIFRKSDRRTCPIMHPVCGFLNKLPYRPNCALFFVPAGGIFGKRDRTRAL